MNGYLLVARMDMDDLPLRLFPSKKEMVQWINANRNTLEDEISNASRRLDWSNSETIRIDAVRFTNGKPVQSDFVQVLEC